MKKNYGYKKLFNVLLKEEYSALSIETKVLFCLIVDRMNLSVENKFIDVSGQHYVIFTNNEICNIIKCSHTKATKLLKTLEKHNLITRKKRGQGNSDLIYLTKESREIIDSGNGININKFESIERAVKKQIEYDVLIERYNNDLIDSFVHLITDIFNYEDDYISIANRRISINIVKKRFENLTAENIEYVIKSIDGIDKPIKNIKSYIMVCLYNSVYTTELADYFSNQGD